MAKPLNPGQFKLFASASEIQSMVTESGDRRYKKGYPIGTPEDVREGPQYKETMDELWQRKLGESRAPESTGLHGAGVYKSLKDEGVRPHTKINVVTREDYYGGTMLGDGHHRVAAAAELERTTGKTHWFNLDNFDRPTYRTYRDEKIKSDAKKQEQSDRDRSARMSTGTKTAINDLVKVLGQ